VVFSSIQRGETTDRGRVPIARMKREHPELVPEITEDDERRADEIIAAGKLAARRRPRLRTARPAGPALGSERAADGELDAVEEVAAAAVDEPVAATGPAPVARKPVAADGFVRWEPVPAYVHATPEPLDLAPFLGASLHCYSAWYCARCYQRRHDPGACPECGRALVPVHVVIVPRETQ
jgi:hypothetical protein